jgi:hypothetical protein
MQYMMGLKKMLNPARNVALNSLEKNMTTTALKDQYSKFGEIETATVLYSGGGH